RRGGGRRVDPPAEKPAGLGGHGSGLGGFCFLLRGLALAALELALSPAGVAAVHADRGDAAGAEDFPLANLRSGDGPIDFWNLHCGQQPFAPDLRRGLASPAASETASVLLRPDLLRADAGRGAPNHRGGLP